jgi:hypothetical protein
VRIDVDVELQVRVLESANIDSHRIAMTGVEFRLSAMMLRR